MALQAILNDLIANNAKSTGFYTEPQLKAILQNSSIEVPNAKPGALTLTYSGPVPGTSNLRTQDIAEKIGKDSNGLIRTIGQTEASQLLEDDLFLDALIKAKGGDPLLAKEIIDGKTNADGTRTTKGLRDDISRRFIAATDGPLLPFTAEASSQRIWTQTEIEAALTESKAPTIAGILKQDLIRLKADLLATSPTPTAADIATADKIVA